MHQGSILWRNNVVKINLCFSLCFSDAQDGKQLSILSRVGLIHVVHKCYQCYGSAFRLWEMHVHMRCAFQLWEVHFSYIMKPTCEAFMKPTCDGSDTNLEK
jgi:hypothetical protein